MAELTILWEFGIIIAVAAALALIFRLIKQPPFIAYLLTGILVGPFAFDILQSTEEVETFARIGVAFLLFIVGLSLDYRVLREVGKSSVVVGLGQILMAGTVSFLIAIGLGFGSMTALFLAVALSFSSTVVVVKILSDKNETDTIHGRLSIGILIVQDFVAALALMIVPVLGSASVAGVFLQLGKAILLVAAVFFFAYFILGRLMPHAAKSQELLFIASIAWALIIAVLFDFLAFSLEIGALVAGMALASSRYSLEIRGKMLGLRDFFVIHFFVFFGAKLVAVPSIAVIGQALLFSVFILIGTPFIVMLLMKWLGHDKQTSFFTGINIAQISEFSLIFLLLGVNLGVAEITESVLSLAIVIALLTIGLSSYGMYYSRQIFRLVSGKLGFLENKRHKVPSYKASKPYDVIVFGYNRIGFSLIKAIKEAKKKVLVIDFNPTTVEDLTKKDIHCLYGDANDYNFLSSLPLSSAKVVISTIPLLDTNLTVLEAVENTGNRDKIVFMPTANHLLDAKKLYKEGADYVIMPHFLGGDFIAHLLKETSFKKSEIKKARKKQVEGIKEREEHDHEHPHKGFQGM